MNALLDVRSAQPHVLANRTPTLFLKRPQNPPPRRIRDSMQNAIQFLLRMTHDKGIEDKLMVVNTYLASLGNYHPGFIRITTLLPAIVYGSDHVKVRCSRLHTLVNVRQSADRTGGEAVGTTRNDRAVQAVADNMRVGTAPPRQGNRMWRPCRCDGKGDGHNLGCGSPLQCHLAKIGSGLQPQG